MIPGGGHIVRHLIFKGQHPLHVHIPGAGDEIFFVGVFTGKLKADEVTAVIEVPVVHKIILVLHPAGGLHLLMLSRSSVGIRSTPTQASATPQRPRLSSSL